MAKKIMAATLIAFAAVATFCAGPYLAIVSLKSALRSGDPETLREKIDFPAVRESLKEQVSARVMASVAANLDDNPFAAVGIALASSVVDRLIESLVTTEGLARLARAQQDSNEAPVSDVEYFPDAERTFVGFDRLDLKVSGSAGEVTFIFRRRGFMTWPEGTPKTGQRGTPQKRP